MTDHCQKDSHCSMYESLAAMYDELSDCIAVVTKRHLGAEGVVLRQMRTTARNNADDCREAVFFVGKYVEAGRNMARGTRQPWRSSSRICVQKFRSCLARARPQK